MYIPKSETPRLLWILNNGHFVCFDNTPFHIVTKKHLTVSLIIIITKKKVEIFTHTFTGYRETWLPCSHQHIEYEVFTNYKVSFSDSKELTKKLQMK